jgi:hypothetical protein
MCWNLTDEKLRLIQLRVFAALSSDKQLAFEVELQNWFANSVAASEAEREVGALRSKLFGPRSERTSVPVQKAAARRQRDARLLYDWLLRQAHRTFRTMCRDIRRRKIRGRLLRELPDDEMKRVLFELKELCQKAVGPDDAEEVFSEAFLRIFSVTQKTAPLPEVLLAYRETRNWRPRGDWLLREAHRISWRRILIDIHRVRWGRRFELVQLDDDANLESEASSEIADFGEERIERIWRGLMVVAAGHFGRGSDALAVLRLLSETDQISFVGNRWPIGKIVDLLNRDCPHPPWTARRADNARQSIRTWIAGLKRRFGLNWDYAVQISARIESGVLPLLEELVAAGRDDVPQSRAELRGLASAWTESDLQLTRLIVDALRREDRPDLQQCMIEVTLRLSLSGPPLRLLEHIADDGPLKDKFDDRKLWDPLEIKTILNRLENGSFWTVGKVDDAKHRLQDWLKSVKSFGIDLTNLDVLFSRVAGRSKE